MDRYLINTDLNGDLVFSVNTGGSQQEALRVHGSSAQVAMSVLDLNEATVASCDITSFSATDALITTLSASSTTLSSFFATNGSVSSFLATTSSLTTAKITTANITTGNITTANITTGNITTANITTGNITTANLTTGNITTANITSANITLTNPAYLTSAANPTLTSSSADLVLLTGGSTLTLPGDVLAGRSFRIINTSASAITIKSSASATVAAVLAGKTLHVTALQNNPTTASHWLVVSFSKQIEKGTAVASAITRASTTYGAFSTNVGLTFTAAVSGKYKVYSQSSAELSVTTSTYGVKIEATAGSPTSYWSPQNATAGTLITGTSRSQVLVQRIDTLVAGTSYTYALYGAATSGTLTLKGDLAEIAILAEQIE